MGGVRRRGEADHRVRGHSRDVGPSPSGRKSERCNAGRANRVRAHRSRRETRPYRGFPRPRHGPRSRRSFRVGAVSANLDFIRSLYAAWERADWSSAEWAHPEIEWVIADGPTPGSWTGVAGMVEGFRGILGAWEEFRAVADEYRELDAERVLVLIHWGGRGKTSGLEVEQMRTKGAQLFHV